MINKLDDKTKNYLAVIRGNYHFVGSNGGEELSLKEILKKKGVLDQTIITELWKEDGFNFTTILYKYEIDSKIRYCAEIWVRYDIDGLYTHTFIFDKEPNRKTVNIIKLVEDVETYMNIGTLKPNFTCWECGKESHWLEDNPSIKEFEDKYNNLKEKYCGC